MKNYANLINPRHEPTTIEKGFVNGTGKRTIRENFPSKGGIAHREEWIYELIILINTTRNKIVATHITLFWLTPAKHDRVLWKIRLDNRLWNYIGYEKKKKQVHGRRMANGANGD